MVTFRTKQVTKTERFAYLDGWRFRLDDLVETLDGVADSGMVIRDREVADHLVKTGVLASAGTAFAQPGPRFGEVLSKLHAHAARVTA